LRAYAGYSMPQRKWIRRYQITIQTPEGVQFLIEPPISVSFEISRNALADANDMSLSIYNLARSTRNSLFKDRYSLIEYWQIVVKAGYDRLFTVFRGNIQESQSYRDGTNWITELQCYDGMHSIQNGQSDVSFSGETPYEDIVRGLISDFPTLNAGAIGSPAEGESVRGSAYSGSTSQILDAIVDGNYFIDLEELHILARDEILTDQVYVLDERQLFATPSRRDTFIDVEILFYPEVQIGRMCELRSTERVYNGQYKVVGLTHNVEIRGDVAGNAVTELQLDAGTQAFREVTQ